MTTETRTWLRAALYGVVLGWCIMGVIEVIVYA